jgi:hypothetical protein
MTIEFARVFKFITAPKLKFDQKKTMVRNMKRPSSRLAKRYKYGGKIRTTQEWAVYCNIGVNGFRRRLVCHRKDPHRYPLEWVFRRFI